MRQPVLPTLGKTFRPVRRKNLAAEKKSGPLLNLVFWRHFGWWKFCYLCLCVLEKSNIIFICPELERLRGEKQIFKKMGPFSALSSQNRPNFGCSFVWLYFFRPFLNYEAKQPASWQHWWRPCAHGELTKKRCWFRWLLLAQPQIRAVGKVGWLAQAIMAMVGHEGNGMYCLPVYSCWASLWMVTKFYQPSPLLISANVLKVKLSFVCGNFVGDLTVLTTFKLGKYSELVCHHEFFIGLSWLTFTCRS